ncbi:hypothetical protein ACRRTK_017914 [Alexandromys fortis]
MKAAGVLALIISLSVVAESKVYTRCKLAKIFVKAGLDNYGGFSLGNCEIPPCLLAPSTLAYEHQPGGICMAYYESHYNTTVQKVLEDGSTDYGIFQINSFTWCRNVRLQQKNHCHVACSGKVTALRIPPEEHRSCGIGVETPQTAKALLTRTPFFAALITDDLTDAILCAKKIVKETQGMNYWQGWKKHCEGKDMSEWMKGCDVS